MQSWFTIEIDGAVHRLEGRPVQATFGAYLEEQGLEAGLVILLDANGAGRSVWRLVDSQTILLPSLAGRRVLTVGGILQAVSDDPESSHPVVEAVRQRAYLDCSSANRDSIAAALFEGYYRNDLKAGDPVRDQFDFCVSRTADYGGMRDTARDVFAAARQTRADARQRARVQGVEKEFRRGLIDIFEDPFSKVLTERFDELPEFAYVDPDKHRFYRPTTLPDLLKLRNQYPESTLLGGGVGIARGDKDWANLISTEGITTLNTISDGGDQWEIGSAVSLTAISEALGASFPALAKLLRRYGSRPIRNRATLGGYLGASEPDGELSALLIALDAKVLIMSLEGEREVSVASLFEGGKGDSLRSGEVIGSILVPRFTGEVLSSRGCKVRLCDAYKAAPRREQIAALITGGFAVEIDQKGNISQAWLVYSGVSDRPIRARETERALGGRAWSEETVIGVLATLAKEIELPEGGSRASREYRRQLIITLFQKFYYQHARPDGTPMELGAVSEFLA